MYNFFIENIENFEQISAFKVIYNKKGGRKWQTKKTALKVK